jgi:hypothetical protein
MLVFVPESSYTLYVMKRDRSLTMNPFAIEDLRFALDLSEAEYGEALDREDYKTAYRVFGDIEALRQELNCLLEEEAEFAAEDYSYLPDSLDAMDDDVGFEEAA